MVEAQLRRSSPNAIPVYTKLGHVFIIVILIIGKNRLPFESHHQNRLPFSVQRLPTTYEPRIYNKRDGQA